jgi:hypothetical protein
MQHIKVILLMGCLLLTAYSAQAQTANPYQLAGSLSMGGGMVSGGSYQVGVALGQASAGEASGGGYTLGGGVFGGGQVTPPQPPRRFVYAPLVKR